MNVFGMNESDREKIKKKQQIVRNEFETVGKYGFPLIRKQEISVDKVELWGYGKAKPYDEEYKDKTIHFFMHDWLFESVYAKPNEVMEKLGSYYALLTPDFSCYYDMPIALQINSTFKNRWCGAYWQSLGKRVIPTMEWGLESSWEFCFDGVEKGGTVAVSTYRREHYKKQYMKGYNRMLEVVEPSAIICYGIPFDGMDGNIKYINPFNQEELVQKLGWKGYIDKMLAGELYPSN